MGSGKYLKNAYKKHGKQNFQKSILHFCDSYDEALLIESNLVDQDFIERNDTYNLKTGGLANVIWSKEMLQRLSDNMKNRWNDPDERQKILESFKKRDYTKIKAWIENNPERHKERMLKINKNPDKIEKTRQKHIGSVRSIQTKENISSVLRHKHKVDEDFSKRVSGANCIYIHNPTTKEIKRVNRHDPMPTGWMMGSGEKNKESYKNLNVGSFFGYDPKTKTVKRFRQGDNLPEGWVKGRPKHDG
jgi:hypothetical protein